MIRRALYLFFLLFGLSSSFSFATNLQSNSQTDLVKALGGADVLRQGVMELYKRVLSDPRLLPYFDRSDLSKIMAGQVLFMQEFLNGDLRNIEHVRRVHEKMGIHNEAFIIFLEHFHEALQVGGASAQATEAAINRLIESSALITPEGAITGKSVIDSRISNPKEFFGLFDRRRAPVSQSPTYRLYRLPRHWLGMEGLRFDRKRQLISGELVVQPGSDLAVRHLQPEWLRYAFHFQINRQELQLRLQNQLNSTVHSPAEILSWIQQGFNGSGRTEFTELSQDVVETFLEKTIAERQIEAIYFRLKNEMTSSGFQLLLVTNQSNPMKTDHRVAYSVFTAKQNGSPGHSAIAITLRSFDPKTQQDVMSVYSGLNVSNGSLLRLYDDFDSLISRTKDQTKRRRELIQLRDESRKLFREFVYGRMNHWKKELAEIDTPDERIRFFNDKGITLAFYLPLENSQGQELLTESWKMLEIFNPLTASYSNTWLGRFNHIIDQPRLLRDLPLTSCLLKNLNLQLSAI